MADTEQLPAPDSVPELALDAPPETVALPEGEPAAAAGIPEVPAAVLVPPAQQVADPVPPVQPAPVVEPPSPVLPPPPIAPAPLAQQPKPRSPKKLVIYIVAAIVILILAAAAFLKFGPKKKTTSQTQAQPQTQQHQATNEQSLGFVSAYKEDTVPLKDVPNYEAVKQKYDLQLTPAQEKYLDDNRFLLVSTAGTKLAPGTNFDDMMYNFDYMGGSTDIYARAPEDAKLVTPDVVLHAYHKFFEMTLEQLEQNELAQSLGDFLDSLQSNLATASRSSSGTVQQRYQNLLAQVTVARVLFENKSPAKPDSFASPDQEAAYNASDATTDSYDNAKVILSKYTAGMTPSLVTAAQQELQYIYKATDVTASPLFSQYSDTLQTDYTQYTPRSHYTKNSALRAYFRTMMYLGRSSYLLQKDVGIVDTNLLTEQFSVKSSTGITPVDPWNKIMAVTGYYAGQSDDLTYTQWQSFEAAMGSTGATDATLSSQDTVQKMAGSLNQLKMPQILSDVVVDPNIASQTKSDLLRQSLGFRVFGQRFTLDAWVLNDLTAGQELSTPKLPSTPSALFVSAAMGDQQAKQYSGEFLKQDAGFSDSDVQGFDTKLAQKQSDLGKVTKDEWFASMGSAWLYVLGALTHDYGTGYPMYMQSLSFLDKQIQTFLGSFTELKHDTLLYAKQSYAEIGGGGDDGSTPPPVVKGFVEPNIDFWTRFSALVANTQDVFTKNNLLTNSTATDRLKSFRDITDFYASIAKQEMQGQPISDSDYEKIRTTGLSFMVQPFDPSVTPDDTTGKVALVADIHTDAVKNQILYEGDAQPYLMLAIVGNEGTPRVVASMVYNHYEFTNPLGGQRLTDETWKSWVYDQIDKLPAKNFWYDSLQAK